MGFWDIEDDIEDFIEDDFVQEEDNKYLASEAEAVRLISKVISLSTKSQQSRATIQKLNNMLDVDFLSAFRNVQLKDEAHLQMKLISLSDKLVEQKKNKILKNKSVVGIGGKFSAGKSKFINSILKAGENLLPEDQNPTTSIPTYIVYGQDETISAYTTEDDEVKLDLEALQALTHKFYEKYEIGFSAFINSLIISEPNIPYKSLVFLDTPGYSKADLMGKSKNQKDLTDENKAYIQLRSVDYLIWLIDIENGTLSEPDIAFISKLGLETPILIVANKADKKIDEEIEEIVSTIEYTAKNAGLNIFAVTAYSSRDNEEWKSAHYITSFLNQAMKKKKSKDNILEQIEEICKSISEEINDKINKKEKERNALSDVIFKSNDIMEIKTLIDLYGEAMEEIRNLKICRRQFKTNVNKLKRKLEKHYGGR